MITENVSTLKINKLTQEQYNREFEAGRIDSTALYLTPDDNVADYIVEQGTSNSWEYRKWNSGLIECWTGYSLFDSETCSHPYGGLYRTKYGLIQSYPITFVGMPQVYLSIYGGEGRCFGIANAFATHAHLTFVSDEQDDTGIYYCLNVVGKWK